MPVRRVGLTVAGCLRNAVAVATLACCGCVAALAWTNLLAGVLQCYHLVFLQA